MHTTHYFSALLVAGGVALSAPAADLSKIDRSIAKEPPYRNEPRYCLVVLGPEAKTRIWLVQDGNTLYIDRNGNGDLTEKGKTAAWAGASQSWVAGQVTGSDGKSKYGVSLRKFPSSMRLTVVAEEGKKRSIIGDPDDGPLVFAGRPSEAPVVHIGGPLSVQLSYYGLGAGSMALRVRVGTPGLGTDAFAGLVLPDVVAPVAEIEFPSKEPGGKPIVQKETLKGR
jgi:hypothetical protein